MKRTVALLVSGVLFVGVLVLGVVSKMQAQQNQQQQCSLNTLQGTYGIRLTGFRIFFGTAQPVATIASATFDGAGKIVNGLVTNNTNGSSSPSFLPFSGTYTVNPNCTGSTVITAGMNTSTADLIIVAQGSKVLILETTSGIVNSGVAIKQ